MTEVQNFEDFPKVLGRLDKEYSFRSEADMVVVLGRGVEKTPKGKWRPTSLIEKGQGERLKHTGIANKSLTENDPNVVMGGGNANVYATFHYLEKMVKQGRGLPKVIFSAGRPDYLQGEEQDLSEGSVMREKLRTLARTKDLEEIDVSVIDQNKSTIDDVTTALQMAVDDNKKNVVFITVEPHLERTHEMIKKVLLENANLRMASLNSVTVSNSWTILEESGEGKKGDNIYKRIFEELRRSVPFERTSVLEKRGLEALKNGIVR